MRGAIILQAKSKYSSDAAKFSTLSLVWSLIAIGAYIALPWVLDYTNKNSIGFTGWQYTAEVAQKGAGVLKGVAITSLGDPKTLALFIMTLLIPVALVAVFVTSLVIRGHMLSLGVVRLYIISGIVGLIATLTLFIPYVASDPQNQKKFAFAAGVVITSGIIARLQSQLRNLFKRNPAIASIGLLAISYAAIWLADQATITSIVLTQIGIWLSLAAFAIVLYSGLTLRREAIRAGRK